MKILVIYYSHTGNNAALAEKIAKELNAETFRLRDQKNRTMKRIVLDMMLHRSPRLQVLPNRVDAYELVLFIGPVWMFSVNSPLKSCMKAIRKQIDKYAFVSLSGGALGPNTKLAKQLKKLLGKNQALHLDLPIKYFCTMDKEPDQKETSSYLLCKHPDDLDRVSSVVTSAVSALRI